MPRTSEARKRKRITVIQFRRITSGPPINMIGTACVNREVVQLGLGRRNVEVIVTSIKIPKKTGSSELYLVVTVPATGEKFRIEYDGASRSGFLFAKAKSI